jgi:hypothetical protein
MGVPRKLLEGKKFNRRHSTIIEDAVGLIKAIKGIGEVTKISIGVIKPTNHGTYRVKALWENHATAVALTVRGKNAVQDFWIYGSPLDVVYKKIVNEISEGK